MAPLTLTCTNAVAVVYTANPRSSAGSFLPLSRHHHGPDKHASSKLFITGLRGHTAEASGCCSWAEVWLRYAGWLGRSCLSTAVALSSCCRVEAAVGAGLPKPLVRCMLLLGWVPDHEMLASARMPGSPERSPPLPLLVHR